MIQACPTLKGSSTERISPLPGPFPYKRLGRSSSRELLSFSANMHACSLGPIHGNLIPALLHPPSVAITAVSDLHNVLKAETCNEPPSYRHQTELKELQAAKQLLIQQKVELQGKVEAAQASLEQEQREHQKTRDSIKQKQQQLKAQTDKLQQQLASEVKAKEEVENQREEAEVKMSMQVAALNENMATLKREWQSSQRRVGELEKQTDELRGEIAVLEATVQNNQDERRALLERCVQGEGEIEKLQAKLVEMRRKLDDTTAAMQELGRENQSLQIKQSQSLTRKWAEDHEVQNCMACGKGFSVTVRKHHCRHCGNIFCAECSARNTLTPSSKKPVRVCDNCFDELQV
ncbi:early endosome antigen 1-like [Sinocyclocheilus anshuiensis]|uniref:early endosome antigen 1-like n=1 Tax=Sinocyclocheilus anshuiensis TaxID=1608454 RepID=UPI0007B92CDB|nr:PREDICTED: early endosome antigen 1-like [Sinocyclocheilus anshuiensis]